MVSELPNITEFCSWFIRNGTLVEIVLNDLRQFIRHLESGQFYIESEIVQLSQLIKDEIHVPLAQLTEPVVCEYVCPPLFLSQTLDKNTRHCLDAKFLCRHDATVACNEVVIAVYQTWSQKSEL